MDIKSYSQADQDPSSTDINILKDIFSSFSDSDKFAKFLKKYKNYIFKYLSQFGCKIQDADDVFNVVFIKISKNIHQFERQKTGSFRAWLKIIVKRTLIDLLHELHKLEYFDPALLERQDEATKDLLDEIDKAYYKDLMALAMARARLEFEPRSWDIFEEFHLNSLNAEAIAKKYDLEINTVYAINYRILKRLRVIGKQLDKLH